MTPHDIQKELDSLFKDIQTIDIIDNNEEDDISILIIKFIKKYFKD